MAFENISGLSLLSQYDDLCRHVDVLKQGCENEFKQFVQNLPKLQQELRAAQAEIHKLKMRINALEMEKKGCEGQIKQLESLFGEEISKRRKLESENKIIAKKLAIISDVILAQGNPINAETKEKVKILLSDEECGHRQYLPGLTTIEDSIGSLLSSSDCDDTFEQSSLNISCPQKRPFTRNYGNQSYEKRKKLEKTVTSQFATDQQPDLIKIDKVPEVEKCLDVLSSSELSSISSTEAPVSAHQSDCELMKSCSYNLRNRTNRSTTLNLLRNRSDIIRLPTQDHCFVSKSAVRSERCYSCDKLIGFCKQTLKCNNCKMTCHPECKNQCPAICIPLTPCSTKGSESLISDYTSSTSSMIPSLIIHCVNEIESRGLKDIGLYRISGMEKEVKDIKEKLLKGKNLINLKKVHIHALCGTIKSFLRSLKEPLIPTSAWPTLVKVTEQKDKNRSLHLLYNLVCDLPQPNKETLAFLMLHLQRVGESTNCKMPVDSLARVLGPTIIGYSSPSLSNSNLLKETAQQCSVMKKLLILPSDCWQNILSKVSANSKSFSIISALKTSNSTSISEDSRIGPVYASVAKDRLKDRKNKNSPRSS
ncbi:rac GTPase-activating protein 1-like isoform X2 [Argiope bruennichi]|nr:rac GTPase-activating protein 1-like isoform X2 [Argiope bruennichi]